MTFAPLRRFLRDCWYDVVMPVFIVLFTVMIGFAIVWGVTLAIVNWMPTLLCR